MRYRVDVKHGLRTVVELHGLVNVRTQDLTVADLELVPQVEQFLEKLTGLRFHIQQEAAPIPLKPVVGRMKSEKSNL